MKRNIYDDNIKDINSIQDIEDLEKIKRNDFNILSNSDDELQFEYCNDFWLLNKKDGNLIQYKDYVSMLNGTGEEVFNKAGKENNKNYGSFIFEQLINDKKIIEDLPAFNLKERKDFIVEPGKAIKGSIRLPAHKVKEKLGKVDKTIDDISSPFQTQETKAIFDLIKALLSGGALGAMLLKNARNNHKKSKMINQIVNKLDENQYNYEDVISDREILEYIPELKEVLERYKNTTHFSKENIEKDINEVMKTDNAQKVMNKISEDPVFQEEIYNQIMGNGENLISDENKLTLSKYMNEKGIDSWDLAKEAVEKNSKEIFMENKKVTAEELTAATLAFSAEMGENKIDKEIFLKKISPGVDKDNVIELVGKLVNKMINKIQKNIEQVQEQRPEEININKHRLN